MDGLRITELHNPVLGEFRLHAVENSNLMRFGWIPDESNPVSDSEKPEGTAINCVGWLVGCPALLLSPRCAEVESWEQVLPRLSFNCFTF